MVNPLIPRNFPFKVEFAGLRGTTVTMQDQGWELAVDTTEDPYRDEMKFKLAGRHKKLNLQLLSGEVRLEKYLMKDYLHRFGEGLHRYFENILIPISFIAPKIEMINYGRPNFGAVDFRDFGMVELDPRTIKRFTLEELSVFRTFGRETELYVPEKKIIDVQEYLKDILVSQEDKQREIRQKMLREGEKFNLSNELADAPKLRLVGY